MPAGARADPGRRDQRPGRRHPRSRDGELHVLGFGMDPDDEAFEAALADQRAARRVRFERTVARLRELGLPIDEHRRPRRPDARRRPRPADDRAGADRRRATPTSVEDAFRPPDRLGRAGLRPARGDGPARGDRGDPRRRRRRRPRPLLGGARAAAAAPRAAARSGLAGLEVYYISLRPETVTLVAMSPQRLGLLATGGSTTTATRRPTPRLTPRSTCRPRCRRGSTRRSGAAERGRAGYHARTMTLTRPDRPRAARARRRCRRARRRAARRRRRRRRPPRRVPARDAGPAELPRLDARLPDEPERLGGDGRPPARRRLRRGARRWRPADLVVINTCAIREAAEQKVIGRQGHLGEAQGGQPGDARRPDRLRGPRAGARRASRGASRRSTSSCGPTRSPSSSIGSGLRRRQGAVGLAGDRRRGDDHRRPDDRRRRRPPARHARGGGRGRRGRARVARSAPGCRSSTAATRPAPTASSRSAAARSAAGRSTRSSTRRARSPPPATARSRCSARTSTRTATTCRPRRGSPHVDTERWAGRRLDLHGRPDLAELIRAIDGDPDRRRRAGDPAPALRHVAPVGPVATG